MAHTMFSVNWNICQKIQKLPWGKLWIQLKKEGNKIFSPFKTAMNLRSIFPSWGGLNLYSGKRGPAEQTCSWVKEHMERIYCNIQTAKKKRYLDVAEVSNQHKLQWWFIVIGDCSCPSCQQTQGKVAQLLPAKCNNGNSVLWKTWGLAASDPSCMWDHTQLNSNRNLKYSIRVSWCLWKSEQS